MDFVAALSSVSMAVFPPVLAVLATVFVPVATTALFKFLESKGLDIEARHREALQSALSNAALVAIQRSTGKAAQPMATTYVDKVTEIVPNVGAAIEYVKQSVPDATKKFNLDTGRIKDLLEPHILEAARRAGVTTKSN